jgi:arylsulfatase
MRCQGTIDARPGHLIDILPTCLEVAGGAYPTNAIPLEGRSLLPALRSQPQPARPIFFEHEGNRAVRDGQWKLVSLAGRPWELYDMVADRVELDNLAPQQPERVQQMAAQWDAWAKRMKAVNAGNKSKPAKARMDHHRD